MKRCVLVPYTCLGAWDDQFGKNVTNSERIAIAKEFVEVLVASSVDIN